MGDDQTNWYDRALASNIVGGLVVGFLVWFVPWAISEATKAKVPFWAYIAVAGVALLFMSVIVPIWRHVVWGGVANGARWVWGLRVTTSVRRKDLFEAGVSARNTSLARERASTPQPAWRIQFGDTHFGAADVHWLYNRGHNARDAALTCDPVYFELDGEAFFGGNWGSGAGGATGKQFRGMPTAKGIAEGVDFTATWRDVNDDEQHRIVRVPPEDIRAGRDALAEQARLDGYREGYDKGFREGVDSTKSDMADEEAHAKNIAPDASEDDPPRASKPSSIATTVSTARRLEIIEHKAKQIETERQILHQMMGSATDDATINKYLDGVADLDEREKLLNGERKAIEVQERVGDKVIRTKRQP